MVGGFLAACGLLWTFLWPLPDYVESPGSADNLKSFVTIKGHPDRKQGAFMITSVRLAQARPITYLLAKVLPYHNIQDEEDVTGGQDDATYLKMQRFYMQSAINEAKAVAVKAAGDQVTKRYLGIYVMSIQTNSHFKKKLRVGDTITKVDGHHFQNAFGFQRYINSKKIGQRLTITVKRNSQTLTQKAALIRLPTSKKAGIGISLTDNVEVKTKPTITVNPGEIGGPSGGLMFSLQIYQQLTNENLRRGRKVAGTGTINPDGTVGEIGGIDKKVVAAKKAGATVFLAPYVKPTKATLALEEDHLTNYQLAKKTAQRVAPNMKVVPVKSFKEAVQYLKTS